ncbi:MAG: hypothetical protein GX057_01215 [Clostridiales bacterium]|nr:hypothetical protein [Clostridiales bacterium]
MKTQKKLENFFTRNDSLYIFGGGLLAAALICVWLAYAYFAYILYIFGSIAAPAGLVMFILGSVGQVAPEDIDKAVSDKLWEYDKELLENVRLAKRMLKHLKPASIAHYDYEGKDLKSKKCKDGWRTSQYTAVKIFFLADALKFVRKTVSVLYDDDEHNITEVAEYQYSELAGAEILRDTVTLKSLKNSYQVRRARLKLTAKDGRTLLLVQVSDDIDSDTLADNINRLIAGGLSG